MKKFIFILCAIVIASPIFSQTGNLDNTFDLDGKVVTNFGSYAKGYGVVIQPDNKIVVAGSAYGTSTNGFAVARYNQDGSLDGSFSLDGKVITSFGNSGGTRANALSFYNNKIIVVGQFYNGSDIKIGLARYNQDGSLDNTFSGDGKVTTSVGYGDNVANAVVVQQDGKILIAGTTEAIPWPNTSDAFLIRYNSNGSIDSTFGTYGKVITDVGNNINYGNALALIQDQKILIAGSTFEGEFNRYYFLAQYNLDGSLDDTFGTTSDGITVTQINGAANAVCIQPWDGKILITGDIFRLARFMPDGALDINFGNAGIVTTFIGNVGDYPTGTSVLLQSDEKIIVSGYASIGSSTDFVLARFDPNGSLDQSFGNSGITTTDFLNSSADFCHSAAIQSNERIILVGEYFLSPEINFALARYLSDTIVGIVNLSVDMNSSMIFPNPLKQNTTLKYSLNHPEVISIYLLDIQGKTVDTYINHEKKEAGEHQQTIMMPDSLPHGTYFIIISSVRGRVSVKVVK